MFDLLHHQLILQVLRSLNAELFTEVQAYFGGGTLITLLHGEYRWSKDIDFMCPYGPGYSMLMRVQKNYWQMPTVGAIPRSSPET